MKTFVIAEAGSNHNGDFNNAIKLIDVAKDAGASAVKFQTAKSETLYAVNTPPIAGHSDVRSLIKSIELPREWQPDLKAYCDSVGIEFMSTPFDEEAVQQLVDIGVSRLKIAGFESSDFRFVEMVASTKLPLIISIGIGFPMKYIGKILDIAEKYGNELTLLHANNAYPTPMSDVGLSKVSGLKQLRGVSKSGLSDHTTSILTPAYAVAAGADVIEKHFTLDRSMEGPDHPFAIEPGELKMMINHIKDVELAMTRHTSEYTPSEIQFSMARRSVVTKVDLKVGDVLTTENTTTMRPLLDNSIPAMEYENIIGKIITKDTKAYHTINKDSIK